MPRAPVPFCGCGGTPHGRGSFCGAYGVRGSAVRARKRGSKTNRYLVAPEPFGDDVRDLEECSGRVPEESAARTYCCSGQTWTLLALLSFRSDLDAAGPSCSGRRGRRVKVDGMAGVPSQWEGTGQEDGESGKAGVPSQWEGTGQEKARRPGFPRNGRERARKAEKAGKPGFPRNGRERARKAEKAGCWSWKRTGIGISSAGSARSFYCHGGTARGPRLAAGAVGELGSARSPGAVGRKKHGFRSGFGRRGSCSWFRANFLHRLGERAEFFRHRERFLVTSLQY
ncbi:hypothetical protein GEV33_013327 [Tenebrio molitor]|uniref:Uncharacterized protein n=1 Tax=Tenebrio molitor TaxID=7067 RepID=A0A8J6L6K9_TENMO|nr:hypothetical protein GEV33_013327 [Tenebrio molitor]